MMLSTARCTRGCQSESIVRDRTSALLRRKMACRYMMLLWSQRASAVCSFAATQPVVAAACIVLPAPCCDFPPPPNNPHGLTAPMLPRAVPHNHPLPPKPCASVCCSVPLSSCQTSQVCVLTMGQAHHLSSLCSLTAPGFLPLPQPAAPMSAEFLNIPLPPLEQHPLTLLEPLPPLLEQHHLVCSPWVRNTSILCELRSVDDVTPVGGKRHTILLLQVSRPAGTDQCDKE
jgi:hypothetical protein